MTPEEGVPTSIPFTSFIASVIFLDFHDILGLLLYIFKHLQLKDTKMGMLLVIKAFIFL